jgi:ABC-2 type transport system permease protein
MRKTLVIAAREYQAAVRTKAFLISLLILPIMMGGGLVVQAILQDKVDITEKRFAVVDRTAGQELWKAIDAKAQQRNAEGIFDPQTHRQTKPVFAVERVEPSADSDQAIKQQRYELSERIRHKELFGFVEIGADVTKLGGPIAPPATPFAEEDGPLPSQPSDRTAIRYQTDSPTYDAFPRWVERVLKEAIQQRRFYVLEPTHSENDLNAVLRPIPFQAKGLTKLVAGQIEDAADEDRRVSFGVPAALMVMMFMLILVGSTPLMQSVVEEKMQRIAEVLLGSVRPFELMMGKLIGMVGVSLTLAAVYLGAAYWSAYHFEFAQHVPVGVLVWFVVYQTLAVLMVGSLFVAVGAACTDMRETQTMVWPVMLLVTFPMFVWFNVIQEPNSTFSTWISFFPFATPMLMLGRQAVPPGIPWWQPAAGVTLVLLTTMLCVYAAGRIFRVGILMQGKGAQVREVVKWVIRG